MLFTVKNIEQRKEAEAMKSHPEKMVKYISAEIEADFNRAIGPLSHEISYHFDTGKIWHLHDLVIYLIKQIGPCRLFISTYSIKEYQARLITGLLSEGLITELHVLMDYRVPTLDPGAAQLIEASATNYGYMRTHSKLAVIINDTYGISITGSANWTNNTTADTGVITIHPSVAEYRSQWIIKHISHESK